ncbi:phage tail protein [Enterobacter cancerogenus]|uniref:phage tail protein n=1 Tax=Enterobacter cancerogenus TaxID=69218 RepID=UPI001299AFD2|nr:phage tail protein [Enterobacter cancerogenus]QGG11399.1 oxidoreductase [Enterobacter cancerogenus]
MMMILGMFVFTLKTTPYQQLERENSFRHTKAERVGTAPVYQYTGPDEEPVTLSGTLYPEVTGGDVSLAALRAMAYTGKAWPLIEGTGTVYGMFVITGLKQTRAEFFSDGKARKIDFVLSLKKVSDDLLENLTDYADQAEGWISSQLENV